MGIVGESGCGKTTLALSVLRLLPRNGYVDSGNVLYKGIDLLDLPKKALNKIRWKEISMVFQGSMNSLSPVLTIADQMTDVYLQKKIASYAEARKKAEQVFARVGLDVQRLDNYPHQFSGGMKQRVMIAMALVCDPALVIADEPTTALDVVLRGEVLELLSELKSSLGLSLVVISHDLSSVSAICDNMVVMYAAKICEICPTEVFFTNPLHPYSCGLMMSFPSIETEEIGVSIDGTPPDLMATLKACRFQERCPRAMAVCGQKEPPLVEISPMRWVSCHLYAQ